MPTLLALLLTGLLAFAGCSSKPSEPAPTSALETPPPTTPTPPVATVVVTTTPAPVTVTQMPAPVTVTATPSPVDSSPAPTTGPETPDGGEFPVLSQVSGVATGPNTADLKWTVRDDGGKVVSRATYATGAQAFGTPTQNGNGTFTIALTGLISCATYTYSVEAIDVGQQRVAVGGGFAMPAGPNVTVVSLKSANTMHDHLDLQWNVTGPGDVVSWVEYGTTSVYGQRTGNHTGSGVQGETISGLTPNAAYNLRVRAKAPCGQATGPNVVIKTATLVHVDITGMTPPYFQFSGLTLPKDTPLVFEVANTDTAVHTLYLTNSGDAPLSPPYGSPDIPAGTTYTFPLAVKLPAGQYHMNCARHATMDRLFTVN